MPIQKNTKNNKKEPLDKLVVFWLVAGVDWLPVFLYLGAGGNRAVFYRDLADPPGQILWKEGIAALIDS